MSVAAGSDKPIDPHTTAGKIEGLRQRRHEAVTRRQKSVDKQHSRGKLTAMERIEMLLDEGSFQIMDGLRRHRSHALDRKSHV